MNKTNPKKIMEIIFIFFLPLLIIISNISFRSNSFEYFDEVAGEKSVEVVKFIEYDNFFTNHSPIEEVIEIPMELLGINADTNLPRMIIEYNILWFLMFIIWHLLYLFFDTIMHKVLLRKE